MKTVAIIIDFDNYFGSNIQKLNSELLEFTFKEWVKLCEQEFTDFNSIQIRLYGGWYKESTFTKLASTVQQLLSNVDVFPKVSGGKIINGKIELATTLHIKPDFVWLHTHKETSGMKRIRINHECIDTICVLNKDTCPKYSLYKFTQTKDNKCHIQSCENIQKDVFKGAEQKMVDTLIACDIISVSQDSNMNGLILISDDQDHLPSLALASETKTKNLQSIVLAIRNEQTIDFISSFMSPFKIKTTLLS